MARSTRRAFLAAAAALTWGAASGCAAPVDDTATGAATDVPTTTATPSTAAGVEMVGIEAGTYTIGSAEGPADARPAHEVDLAAFAIDRFEVTNRAFAAFLNALAVEVTGDAAPGRASRENFPEGHAHWFLEGAEGEERRPLVALDDEHVRIGIRDGRFVVADGYAAHPVTEVTWDGARRFAAWRGVRLPTEAEWEAAARGFEGRRYPWGDEPPTPERAVYGRGSGETAPVGSHPAGATPGGVHHMAGNVSEWTSSLYRPYPYDADDGREDPSVRAERVTRGGAHVFFSPEELRAYYRTGFSREFDRGHRHIGFRCAKSV